jgi:hypothetical protein
MRRRSAEAEHREESCETAETCKAGHSADRQKLRELYAWEGANTSDAMLVITPSSSPITSS